MPEVGMKGRQHFINQINGMSGYVQRQVTVKNAETGIEEVRDEMDVGLLCGLITNELLLDCRDLLIQIAAKEGAILPSGKTLVTAQNIP